MVAHPMDGNSVLELGKIPCLCPVFFDEDVGQRAVCHR